MGFQGFIFVTFSSVCASACVCVGSLCVCVCMYECDMVESMLSFIRVECYCFSTTPLASLVVFSRCLASINWSISSCHLLLFEIINSLNDVISKDDP